MTSPLLGSLRLAGSTAAAFTSRRCVVSTASTAVAAVPLVATTMSSSSTVGSSQCPQRQQQHQNYEQRRSFWMDVVRIKKPTRNNRFNNKNNNNAKKQTQKVHEDPEQVVRRHTDEVRSDGEALLDLMFFNDRHEKAWMKRKRLEGIRRYEFDKKHVTDLAKYIAFVQDHKENE